MDSPFEGLIESRFLASCWHAISFSRYNSVMQILSLYKQSTSFVVLKEKLSWLAENYQGSEQIQMCSLFFLGEENLIHLLADSYV